MKYSIVVPVLLREENHRQEVIDTLNNLKQMSSLFELIVVNDGSPLPMDDIARLADSYIEHRKNKGISAAWNTGKNAASAEYVAIVNDDVKVPLLWLETLSQAFVDKKTGVSAPMQGGPHIKPYRNAGQFLVESHKFYPGYCFMLRKDRFFEDFDEQFTSNCGDADYWHRIREKDLECKRVGLGVYHKEGGVLHGMDYDKISAESLKKFEKKWGFNPLEEYYS